jgi:hypothetical protein
MLLTSVKFCQVRIVKASSFNVLNISLRLILDKLEINNIINDITSRYIEDSG